MKKKFISIVIITIFTCFLFATENKEYYEFVNEYPTIKLPIDGEEFVFLLDTGASKSIMSNKMAQKLIGDKKIDVSEDEYKEKFEMLLDISVSLLKGQPEYSSFSDEELLEIAKEKAKSKNGFYFTLKNFYFANKHIEEIKLKSYTDYNEFLFDSVCVDGILGTDFLMNFEIVIFDYKKKRIYFDCEPKINRNVVKMYHPIEDKINPIFNDLKSKEEDLGIKVKSFQSAFIPIMLYDEERYFCMDTGNVTSAAIIYAETEDELKESEINKNDTIGNPTYFYKTLRIGNKKYKNVKCCYFTYPGIVALSGEIHKKNEVFKANFLGHDFFKDKIIQFDFKNKTFGIK